MTVHHYLGTVAKFKQQQCYRQVEGSPLRTEDLPMDWKFSGLMSRFSLIFMLLLQTAWSFSKEWAKILSFYTPRSVILKNVFTVFPVATASHHIVLPSIVRTSGENSTLWLQVKLVLVVSHLPLLKTLDNLTFSLLSGTDRGSSTIGHCYQPWQKSYQQPYPKWWLAFTSSRMNAIGCQVFPVYD